MFIQHASTLRLPALAAAQEITIITHAHFKDAGAAAGKPKTCAQHSGTAAPGGAVPFLDAYFG